MRAHLVSIDHSGSHLLEVTTGGNAGNLLTYMAIAWAPDVDFGDLLTERRPRKMPMNGHQDVLWDAAAMAVADWLVPTEQQLTDCRRLADSRAANSPYDAGVSSTVRWIGGLGNSPLTSQPPPASRAAAEQEFHVAAEVELEDSPLSAVIPTATAQGVRRTLAWLLGLDQNPPIELPRRPVPTARQLCDEAVAAEPWRYDLPEARAAAQVTAVREAAHLAELAARADELPD